MGNTFRGGQDRPHKKAVIRVGASAKELPALSIQCFEQRHRDCLGVTGIDMLKWLSNNETKSEKCECRCHKKESK